MDRYYIDSLTDCLTDYYYSTIHWFISRYLQGYKRFIQTYMIINIHPVDLELNVEWIIVYLIFIYPIESLF